MVVINKTLDPARRAAEAIARRNVGQDIETMTVIITNAYHERTEEIKESLFKSLKEAFDQKIEEEKSNESLPKSIL